MDTKQLAKRGVYAVLGVSGARLVLVFLRMDGIPIPLWIEAGLLGLSGVFGALALTGLAMVLADALARSRGLLRKIGLGLAWLAFLAAMCWLIPPYMVAKIRATELVSVLDTPTKQWAWAIVAVAIVEVMAAGGVVAMRDGETPERDARRDTGGVSFGQVLGQIGGAVATRIEAGATRPTPTPAQQRTSHLEAGGNLSYPIEDARRIAHESRELSQEERRQQLLDIVSQHPSVSKAELATRLDVSRSTVYRDIDALQEARKLTDTGDRLVVLEGNGYREGVGSAEV